MPSRIDTLMAGCVSWNEFQDLVNQQRITKDKGDLFEGLTHLYLQTSPTYRTKLKNVWWFNNGELPNKASKKLSLPKEDEGIGFPSNYNWEIAGNKLYKSLVDASGKEIIKIEM